MTTPTLKIELNFAGSTWTDVTSYVPASKGVSIDRGRQNETGTIAPGRATFTLENDDGRFTPGLTTGPYHPIGRYVPVRISAQVGSTWYPRFAGYVSDWRVSWTSPLGTTAIASLTCVDLLALAGLRNLGTVAAQRILAHSPVAYWPLSDAQGTTHARDVSGNGAADLIVFKAGSGGTPLIEFGAAGGLRTAEGAGVVRLERASAAVGYYLYGANLPTPGASFTVVSVCEPSSSGYVWQLSTTGYGLGLYYDHATSLYYVREAVLGAGWTYSTLATSSAVQSGLHVEIVTVTASQVVLLSDATRAAGSRTSSTAFTSPTMSVGSSAAIASTEEGILSGTLSHVAIIPSALTMTAGGQAETLRDDLEAVDGGPVEDFIADLLSWAGYTVTVGTLGGSTDVGLMATDGKSAASVIADISTGALGRFFVALDGDPTWAGFHYAPTATAFASTDLESDITWETDLAVYVTEVTTSLPSGGSYTATTTATAPRGTSIEGVLPTDEGCKAVADWLVDAATLAPRIPDCAFDILTNTDTVKAAVLALDIGSRITISDLPAQIPDDQALTIEGHSERISATEWLVGFNTSPTAAGDWLILNDATYGQMDSTHELAPV